MMENTRCPDCRVKLRKELTNRATLEDIPIEDLGKYPGCLDTVWTGRWICPKCKRIFQKGEEKNA